jgi:hypothetical protein
MPADTLTCHSLAQQKVRSRPGAPTREQRLPFSILDEAAWSVKHLTTPQQSHRNPVQINAKTLIYLPANCLHSAYTESLQEKIKPKISPQVLDFIKNNYHHSPTNNRIMSPLL